MANLCSFSMLVKGKHDDIAKFYDAMRQNGHIWMGRGADAEIDYDDNFDLEGHDRATIDGWCKWSIQSALYDNAISMRREPERWFFGNDVDNRTLEFITFVEASEKWNLDIEVFSEENGCGFQEHYIIRNGIMEVDKCVDWCEYFLDDYDSKEEAEEDLEIEFTDEEWGNSYAERGGFGLWEFEI